MHAVCIRSYALAARPSGLAALRVHASTVACTRQPSRHPPTCPLSPPPHPPLPPRLHRHRHRHRHRASES
eukprot:1436729-Rhodomonas_salina.1